MRSVALLGSVSGAAGLHVKSNGRLTSVFQQKRQRKTVAKQGGWDVVEIDCRGTFGFGCEAFDPMRLLSKQAPDEVHDIFYGKHAFCYDNPAPHMPGSAPPPIPGSMTATAEAPSGPHCVDKLMPGDGGCGFFPPAFYGVACANMPDPETGVFQHYSCLPGVSEPVEAPATEAAFEEGTGGNTGYSCQKCCPRMLFHEEAEADKWCAKDLAGARVPDCAPDATSDPLYNGALSIIVPGSEACLPPASVKPGAEVDCGDGIVGKVPPTVPADLNPCMKVDEFEGGKFANFAVAAERANDLHHEMLVEVAHKTGACPNGNPPIDPTTDAVAPSPKPVGSAPPPPTPTPAAPAGSGPPPPKAPAGPPMDPAVIPEPGAAPVTGGNEPVQITTNPDPESAAAGKAAALTPPSLVLKGAKKTNDEPKAAKKASEEPEAPAKKAVEEAKAPAKKVETKAPAKKETTDKQ
ncbi:unnamed protein product [Amoebophrya sp. A120]|nr:unnamed protein product [Amoebophrya sp. A120]|eukprot:GSA120T00018475001.1